MFNLKNCKGSLLFETLIALLILAVGITASLRLFGQTLQASSRNFDQLRARRYLDNRLFFVFAGTGEIVGDDSSGEEEIPGKSQEKPLKYAWRIEPLLASAAGEETRNIAGTKDYGLLKMSVAADRGNRIFDAETVVTYSRGVA